jgi:hypothetical protein
MTTIIKKMTLILALVCLSMGAFAQTFGSGVYFAPPLPPKYLTDKPDDVTVTYTWFLPGGETKTAVDHKNPVFAGTLSWKEFPGTSLEALSVICTRIDLSFYGNTRGTSQTFPGLAGIVTCTRDFTGNWWQSATDRIKDN